MAGSLVLYLYCSNLIRYLRIILAVSITEKNGFSLDTKLGTIFKNPGVVTVVVYVPFFSTLCRRESSSERCKSFT